MDLKPPKNLSVMMPLSVPVAGCVATAKLHDNSMSFL
jgi:hypothetical protein